MDKKKKIVIACILLLILAFLFSLTTREQSEEKNIVIATTTYPLYDIAKQVGGERAEVLEIIPFQSNPHTYNPSILIVNRIKGVDVLIYNGAGLETWVEDARESLESEGVVLLDSSSYFRAMEYPSLDGDSYYKNPYTWLDPLMVKEKVNIITKTLIEVDPEGGEYYRENSRRVVARLEELHIRYRNSLKNCSKKYVLASHGFLDYIAKRYSFHALSGMKNPPSSRMTSEERDLIVESIGGRDVEHFLYDNLISSWNVGSISSATNTEGIRFNSLIAIGREDREEGYFEIMRENLKVLKEVLDCR